MLCSSHRRPVSDIATTRSLPAAKRIARSGRSYGPPAKARNNDREILSARNASTITSADMAIDPRVPMAMIASGAPGTPLPLRGHPREQCTDS